MNRKSLAFEELLLQAKEKGLRAKSWVSQTEWDPVAMARVAGAAQSPAGTPISSRRGHFQLGRAGRCCIEGDADCPLFKVHLHPRTWGLKEVVPRTELVTISTSREVPPSRSVQPWVRWGRLLTTLLFLEKTAHGSHKLNLKAQKRKGGK